MSDRDGLETIRVVFPDIHGIFRGKTVVARVLDSVLDSGIGVPSTLLLKDTAHRTAFPVWFEDPGVAAPLRGASDVILRADPDSLRILPWSPHSAWLMARATYKDGSPIPFDPQTILQSAVDKLAERGLSALFGLEVEFQVFELVDPSLDHAQSTIPGAPPKTRALNQGYQYLTETRYAAAEPVLDAIRRAAEGIGLPVRSVEIEFGPSQFEVTFDPAPPMEQAANMVMFRTLVKEVCAAQGFHASFMAKPALPNAVGNGWHVHQSLARDGRNLFRSDDGEPTAEALGWIAGLLEHAAASCMLIAPSVTSYKRFQPFQLAPDRIAWGEDNRGAMLRALMAPGDPASRIENRAPDSAANPYLAFAAQILSGLDGLDRGLTPPPPTATPYAEGAERLPRSLGDAIARFAASEHFRTALGAETADYLVHLKTFEWERYLQHVSDWEQAEYFGVF